MDVERLVLTEHDGEPVFARRVDRLDDVLKRVIESIAEYRDETGQRIFSDDGRDHGDSTG